MPPIATATPPAAYRRWRQALAATAAASLLLLAACSSATSGATGSAAPATTEVAPAPGPPPTIPTEPAGPHLAAGGTGAGMCMGYCQREVRVERSAEGAVGLTLLLTENRPVFGPHTTTGRLTAAGRATLAGAERGLGAFEQTVTIGCPDCADGGTGRIVVDPGSGAGEVTVTYPFEAPPAELAAAHELVQQLVTAMSTCKETDLLELDQPCLLPPVEG